MHLQIDLLRRRRDDEAHAFGDFAALQHARRDLDIFEAAVRARADDRLLDALPRDFVDRRDVTELVRLRDDERHRVDVQHDLSFVLRAGVGARAARTACRCALARNSRVVSSKGNIASFAPTSTPCADRHMRLSIESCGDERAAVLDRHVACEIVAVLPGEVEDDVLGDRVVALTPVQHRP